MSPRESSECLPPSQSSTPEVRRARPALGTFVEIRARGLAVFELDAAVDRAFESIARVQSLMSFHDAESDVSRLNRGAHIAPVVVDPWTMDVLECAQNLSRLTEGIFDITIGAELQRWQLLPGEGRSDDLAASSYQKIYFADGGKVGFEAPLTIDLGGIAKGFAVDRAVATLIAEGVSSGVVNAGGDLFVFGDGSENVCVRAPETARGYLPLAEIKDFGLAASTPCISRCPRNGEAMSQLVHGVTRDPLTSARTVAVLAPTCMIADGLTKVVAANEDGDLGPLLESFGAKAFRVVDGEFFVTG